jgi:hypothetical protein
LSIDPVTTDANTGSSFNRYAYANNNPYKYIDPDGRDAIGKLVKLLENGGKIFGKKVDKAEAVAARKAGENVQANTKSQAKQIENAANNGKTEGIMQHKGHELKDGSIGDPHFQTEGVKGHTFWGNQSGAVVIGFLFDMAIPFLLTPSTLAPGTMPQFHPENVVPSDKAEVKEVDEKPKTND